MSPRRATHFSLLRQRKVSKRKATLLSVTPALRSGATCDARAGRGPRETRFAQTARGPFSARHCASRHGQKGTRNHHTGHRCARPRGAQALRAAQCRPSAAMARIISHPLAGCACGGALAGWHARRSAHASLSSSPRLFERSAPARSELCGALRKCPAAGLPRRGRRLRAAFLCLLSCRAQERRSPAGASPGLRLPQMPGNSYQKYSY